jgi:hypothetical protein
MVTLGLAENFLCAYYGIKRAKTREVVEYY